MMKGFTLIDVLIGGALALIFFLGVFGLYELGLKVSYQSQHRAVAAGIANEYMERARTMTYGGIGVVDGYPDGLFESFETVFRNNHSYDVSVEVHYVADPADGIGHPEDPCPNDYKRVVVSVGWSDPFPGSVAMATNVAPAGELEECENIGGILKVNVIDPFGQPISDTVVSVDDVNGSLSDICFTGLGGSCQFVLPESPTEQGDNYAVSVSKSGWNQARTFGSGDIHEGSVIINPVFSHLNLLSGEVTEITFIIGELSTFIVRTVSFREPGIPIGFVELSVRGSKIVGEDADDDPIFGYDRTHETDAGGELTIAGLEWDNYRFETSGLAIREPEGSVALDPGVDREVTLFLEADHSLLINVGGSDEGVPLFSASVRVFSDDFDETLFTDEAGRVLFIPLEEGSYGMEVFKEGYDPFEGSISISGNVTEDVGLVLNPD